jgi:DNA polymerase-1
MAEQFDAIFKKGGTATTNTAAEEAKLYKSPQPKRRTI